MLITSTRALIKTNKEIWERCLPRKEIHSDGTNLLYFNRIGFETVTVTTVEGYGSRELIFETSPEIATLSFADLPKLPGVLSEILPMLPASSYLPDYQSYLAKAAALQEEILPLFLMVLKEHLKQIQVALGEIDAWLLEPSIIVQFLNEQFEEKLQIPEPNCCGAVCCVRHDYEGTCLTCKEPWRYHRGHTCPVNATGYKYGSDQGSFVATEPVHLKAVNMEEGEITKTFQISGEAGREKLKKFLDFVTS